MLQCLKREPGFYRYLWGLTGPIALQNLITFTLGLMDTLMVSWLGNTQMAAVTTANVPVFLLISIVFGVQSGLGILVSQYWGKGDQGAINRCSGVALYFGLSITTLVALTLLLFPRGVMSLVTDNALLVELGAPYVRIVGVSYVFNAASSVYIGMQRSTENPLMGMVVFAVSMLLNTFLNYVFIFGKLGAPALGVTGAALATLLSRITEFAIVAVYALRDRRVPLQPKLLLRPGTVIARDFFKYASPVLLNESLWGLGVSVLTAIMGHMAISAEILAAHAIMGNIEKFSTVACFGVAGATSVIVGKRIGEGASKEEVYSLGCCLLEVSLLVGLVVAVCLAALLPTVFIPYVFPLFHLEGLSRQIAAVMCAILALMMPAKAFDITNITGLLRAGGDARMASVIDLGCQWGIAVPLSFLTALVLNAPVAVVCFAIQSENLCKMPWGIVRLRSRKWINSVTRGGTDL